jgi:hypothetical protein
MANTYNICRYEPMCSCEDTSRVCKIIIGMVGQDEANDRHNGYTDDVLDLEDNKPLLTDVATPEKASELVSQFVADQGFKANIDAQIEASKLRDVPPENFEVPEITLDLSVEPAVGSPANPAPVEEESSSEETSEESSEESSGGE